jgi:hypothetical protein
VSTSIEIKCNQYGARFFHINASRPVHAHHRRAINRFTIYSVLRAQDRRLLTPPQTQLRVCEPIGGLPGIENSIRPPASDYDALWPCQILSSIENMQPTPASGTWRVHTTVMLQIFGSQRPLGPTVRPTIRTIDTENSALVLNSPRTVKRHPGNRRP